MVYRTEHVTTYRYATPVATSHHIAYLRPRELEHQHLRAHQVTVEPPPGRVVPRVDYFGNDATYFEILKPHTELRVAARSVVEVHARPEVRPLESPPWEEVRARLAGAGDAVATAAAQFTYASPYVPAADDFAAYARPSFAAGRPLLDAALDLMRRIHAEFTFDPSATTVAMPVTRVLSGRRGVCQDFAHLQVSCFRSLGLAARYVSGYLLTDPPPGSARLIGADASHAWLSVYCPTFGWVDLDPTNAVVAGTRHVVVAWGRDYGDISPLRGVLLGGADHTLIVGVSVVPLEEEHEPDRTLAR